MCHSEKLIQTCRQKTGTMPSLESYLTLIERVREDRQGGGSYIYPSNRFQFFPVIHVSRQIVILFVRVGLHCDWDVHIKEAVQTEVK